MQGIDLAFFHYKHHQFCRIHRSKGYVGVG